MINTEWMDPLYLPQAVNNTKNQLGNNIPLMYIKNMIHDKNKRKNPGNWDKNIIVAFVTKRSDD